MNKPPLVNQTTFRILYFKYKPFLIPIGVITTSVILFFAFIIPQFQDYLSLQDQKAQLAQRVDVLTKNLTFINSMDNTLLNKNLTIVTESLPQDKDFSQVLNTISNASIMAGVRLGDYSFAVGNLDVGKDTNLQLTLNIDGGINDMSRFITALKNQIPLADVLEVQVAGKSSAISIVFFYKPLPKVSFQPSTPLEQFTAKDNALLKTLETLSLSSEAGPSFIGSNSANLQ